MSRRTPEEPSQLDVNSLPVPVSRMAPAGPARGRAGSGGRPRRPARTSTRRPLLRGRIPRPGTLLVQLEVAAPARSVLSAVCSEAKAHGLLVTDRSSKRGTARLVDVRPTVRWTVTVVQRGGVSHLTLLGGCRASVHLLRRRRALKRTRLLAASAAQAAERAEAARAAEAPPPAAPPTSR